MYPARKVRRFRYSGLSESILPLVDWGGFPEPSQKKLPKAVGKLGMAKRARAWHGPCV